MNFIYILKDGKTVQPTYSSNLSENSADMEARILEKLEKKKEAEKKGDIVGIKTRKLRSFEDGAGI